MKKITKLMMLTLAMGWAAGAMAQGSPSWTFYNPDNIKHQGTQTDHTIYVKVRTAPTLADFNNDGKLEMIYGGQNDGDWDWFYQEKNGEMTWDWGWHYDWNNAAYVIGFNGWDADPVRLDGKTDYWSDVTDTYGIPLGTHNFYRWIDFDNDGNLDLLMLAKHDYDNRELDSEHFALLYRNGGEAEGYKFTAVGKAPFNIVDRQAGFNPNNGYFDGNDRLGRYVRGITFGDVNNDGFVDFVCMNYGDQLSVFLGNGDGSFTKKVQLEEAYREGDVKLADLDGDGCLDIVAMGWNSNGKHVNFYKGAGDGSFENKTPEGVHHQRGGGIGIADFNNDGRLDVFIMGYSDAFGGWPNDLLLNQGNFTFEVKENPIGSFEWVDANVINAFDVDNDGNVDLFWNWGDTNMILCLGNGDGTFKDYGWSNNKQSGDKSGGGYSFGDVYGRNMLDQAICYKEGDNAHVGIIPGRTGSDGNGDLNQAPSAPTNVKAERSDDGTKVTITWDAATDDKTPTASLLYNIYVKYGDVVRMLIPALEETGKLKVVQDMQTLPIGITSYEVSVPADAATVEVGVQAIDGVFAPSEFAKVSDIATGIAATTTTKAAATGKAYNLAGRRQVSPKGISIVDGKKILK
ncbi:MAG: VCBS repeat-containing protein [Prevotella sp.]|nr:VCBS repeat-containing protein [Prevotella sp.]